MKKLFIIFLFLFFDFLLFSQAYIDENSSSVFVNYQFTCDEEVIFIPNDGFLLHPITGKNVFQYEWIEENSGYKLVIYNFKKDNSDVDSWKTVWELEEKSHVSSFFAKMQIPINDTEKLKRMNKIEIVFSYKVKGESEFRIKILQIPI